MKTFKALMKREFWEHKGGMFMTPAIMAAVFAGLLVLSGLGAGTIIIDDHTVDLSDGLPKVVQTFEAASSEMKQQAVQIGLHGTAVVFGFVCLIISLFYALGSLYDERKDRSILFWKSLPVSDTITVLSKFVSITIAVPVCYFVVITAFQIFGLMYGTVLSWFGGASGMSLWANSNLFGVMFNTLFSLIIASIWLAPLWAWLMVASVWANRVPFLWGGLPILMIAVAEGWIFKSTSFIRMIGERIGEAFKIQNASLHNLVGGDMFEGQTVNTAYQSLASSEFWVGIIVAGIFLAGAIYTRRFRDES